MVQLIVRRLVSVRRRREGGAVAVIVALLMLVFIAMAALVVDMGMARDSRRQAQNASDAAALAAGNELYRTNSLGDRVAAESQAKLYAQLNYAVAASEWPGCVDAGHLAVTASNTECISFDRSTKPTQVRVVVPVHGVPTVFGQILGRSTIAVSALAEVGIDPGGRSACGFCVVGPGTHDLQNGDITVYDAGVSVNGTLVANPQGTIEINTTGSDVISFEGTKPNKGHYNPAPLENQPAISDPLAALTLPPDMSALVNKTGSPCTGGPGIYLSSVSVGSCTIPPGLYVFAGGLGLGNSDVVADQVTMYFTCKTSVLPITVRPCNSPGEVGAGMGSSGNGSFRFTAPTNGATAGLALVADRNNTATFSFRGNSTQSSSGTVYLKSGTLDFRGTSGSATFDSLMVIGDISFSGQAPVNVYYTESKNVGLPSAGLRLTR